MEAIKFSTSRGVPIIKVKINGKGCRLLIDNGANSSFVDYNLRKKLNFSTYKSDTNLQGAGGTVKMFDTNLREIEVDGGIINVEMKAINFSNVKGMGVVGILGSDFLIKNKLNIDFSTNQLSGYEVTNKEQ